MIRFTIIAVIASCISLSLFGLMAYLIKQDKIAPIEVLDPVTVEVYQVPKASRPRTIDRKPIEPPKPPPMLEFVKTKVDQAEEISGIEFVSTGLPMNNNRPVINFGGQMVDQDARPLVRANPKYPIKALQNGIEGWVRLGFDINEIGEVINITVIDAQPKRLFDKAAKQALKKWKYKAKSIDGKPIIQTGFSVQLDFTMQENT